MDAMKEALKRKMQDKKPMLEIAIGLGKPVPDQDYANGQIEGDAIDSKKLQEEEGLAPEIEDEGKLHELAEEEMMEGEMPHKEMILKALSDGADHKGRTAMGLRERVADKAKAGLHDLKNKGTKKAY